MINNRSTMITFTTRQREILKIILDVKRPIGSVELAKLLHITPRQVNYSMKGVKVWLKQHGQNLSVLPGIGFAVDLTPNETQALFQKINIHSDVQIILSVSQRHQLLALFLLTRAEPVILAQLEQISNVSRMTILKDLDEIENWLQGEDITLIRKPHFGIQVSGVEHNCEQALAELLWGETPFSNDPIAEITHSDGLNFNLQGDAQLLPLAGYANTYLSGLHMHRAISLVAKAEEQLGGRFTDDAVLHLALIFAIMADRIQNGSHLDIENKLLTSLQSTKMWPIASYVGGRLGREANSIWKPGDVAGIAMEMMAAPRNDAFPGELERESDFSALSERLMEHISQAFGISKLKHDRTLQNGLLNNIVPACFRQRFNLWFPVALNNAGLPDKYEREHIVAREISKLVYEFTGVNLPQSEINNLVVLLRAAFIRNRSYGFDRVIIICPSGMATAQLLVARLHARFPNLSNLEVISLRDLTPSLVSSADLILTTIPLPRQYANNTKVIQVHPLLMPEDIETITQFLS
jgi:mannitol operon transcriptional antiterminator